MICSIVDQTSAIAQVHTRSLPLSPSLSLSLSLAEFCRRLSEREKIKSKIFKNKNQKLKN